MKNIKKSILLALLILLAFDFTLGQSKQAGVTISNNTTGMPVIDYPNLFYSNFHPGIDLSYGWKINKSESNKLYVNANMGMYYHQFIQSLVRIYPNLEYERTIGSKLQLHGALGAGIGISFEGKNAFVLEEDGTYKQKPFLGARTQYLMSVHLGASYAVLKNNPESLRLLIQFRSYMQGTYVKSYVPLLPLNSFQIGILLPLKNIIK